MDTWIKATVNFPFRAARLTFSCRYIPDLLGYTVHGNLAETLKRLESIGAIDTLETILLDLIRQHRPELEGCTLHGISFSLDRMMWEIVVGHGSFHQVQLGDELPSLPLVPPARSERWEYEEECVQEPA